MKATDDILKAVFGLGMATGASDQGLDAEVVHDVAQAFNVDKKTVMNALSELERLGMISKVE